jgi:hypothetical protein
MGIYFGKKASKTLQWQQMLAETRVAFDFLFSLPTYY